MCVCVCLFYFFLKNGMIVHFLSTIIVVSLNVDAGCRRGPDWFCPSRPLFPVWQMAGGFHSPDIHQCPVVRCSRSSDLTCRLAQHNIFPLLSAARTSPNDAAKWSSVSREPNKSAANMARRSDTDVKLPGLGRRNVDKTLTNFMWLAKFKNCVSILPFWTTRWTQVPPGLRTFRIFITDLESVRDSHVPPHSSVH